MERDIDKRKDTLHNDVFEEGDDRGKGYHRNSVFDRPPRGKIYYNWNGRLPFLFTTRQIHNVRKREPEKRASLENLLYFPTCLDCGYWLWLLIVAVIVNGNGVRAMGIDRWCVHRWCGVATKCVTLIVTLIYVYVHVHDPVHSIEKTFKFQNPWKFGNPAICINQSNMLIERQLR